MLLLSRFATVLLHRYIKKLVRHIFVCSLNDELKSLEAESWIAMPRLDSIRTNVIEESFQRNLVQLTVKNLIPLT